MSISRLIFFLWERQCTSHTRIRGRRGRKNAYGIPDESKTQVAKDVFTTESEAEARAEEIGCTGFTAMIQITELYMPCASHADYTRLTGDELTTPSKIRAMVRAKCI